MNSTRGIEFVKQIYSSLNGIGPPNSASRGRFQSAARFLLLAIMTIVIYLPALNGKFIWDDENHVTRPELRSLDGLRRIWFDLGATQQYYPLLHSVFWAEYKLWGNAPQFYPVANLFEHIAAAWLVYLILRRLRVPGGFFAALIFAVHPVMVESVAWISEQKNTLSAVFYLSAMLAYLRFVESRALRKYAIALFLFVCALLCKTVTATLPAAILVIIWWQRGQLSWKRHVQPLLPFFLFGIGGGLLTAWVERNLIGAAGTNFDLSLAQRILLAGRVPWFYLTHLVWPSDLIFIYPRWNLDPADWRQWLYPAGTGLVLLAVWNLRVKWRAPLAGCLYFLGTLFPALGFFNVYPFIYSFVADHFQYLASLGIIVPIVAGLTLLDRSFADRWPVAGRWLGRSTGAILAALLVFLSWRQSQMYGDVIELYTTIIKKNPDCWMAYNNLGAAMLKADRVQDALDNYQRALQLKFDDPEAQANFGAALTRTGRVGEAIDYFQRALKNQANDQLHANFGLALAQAGRLEEAISQYQQALELNPDALETRNNLGNALLAVGRS
jgi:tetratricopeptide (TPR) repeat protein